MSGHVKFRVFFLLLDSFLLLCDFFSRAFPSPPPRFSLFLHNRAYAKDSCLLPKGFFEDYSDASDGSNLLCQSHFSLTRGSLLLFLPLFLFFTLSYYMLNIYKRLILSQALVEIYTNDQNTRVPLFW
jgi:hypothetical protein